ncbi:DoxX family protein [Pedobacter changchengzhani]|uniref:DoxX family protein n=1 Tax=Pedobacter changchengzhani TaxID=2529274 RepID=A0A4R5MHN6_9SPHI|nr:DoxX family protein [Pedobacter changchengzhani]TDG35001.1 DoxX family protein [Pedobacter changchengzhani]
MLGIKITEAEIVAWKSRNGMNILRICLGIIFVWFGVLKFFHGISSAEEIAGRTILKLTFGLITPTFSMPLLAVWECIIGIGLITKAWLRLTLVLLYMQMAGTFLPLVFFPHETFNHSLFVPTLLGQYIIKNLVLISGGIVIGATLSGHKVNEKRV